MAIFGIGGMPVFPKLDISTGESDTFTTDDGLLSKDLNINRNL